MKLSFESHDTDSTQSKFKDCYMDRKVFTVKEEIGVFLI